MTAKKVPAAGHIETYFLSLSVFLKTQMNGLLLRHIRPVIPRVDVRIGHVTPIHDVAQIADDLVTVRQRLYAGRILRPTKKIDRDVVVATVIEAHDVVDQRQRTRATGEIDEQKRDAKARDSETVFI
jgi:hypothetical protein